MRARIEAKAPSGSILIKPILARERLDAFRSARIDCGFNLDTEPTFAGSS